MPSRRDSLVGRSTASRRRRLGIAAVPLACLALWPAAASAAPTPFWKACEAGSGAGQCEIPAGIAVDPNLPGHLYVADAGNNRIVELSAWGEFLKAWGWGVADGSAAPQVCTSSCQPGVIGGGPGQLDAPMAMAVDGAGNIYVAELFDPRVQKFNAAGEFQLMFGGGVLDHGGTTGSGTLTTGSSTVSSVATISRSFAVGQTINGAGIPAQTTIKAIGPGTITLSAAATASGAAVSLAVPATPGITPNNELQSLEIKGSPSGGTFTLSFSTAAPSNTSSTTANIPFNASAGEVAVALEANANIGAGNVAVSGPAGGPYVVEFKGSRFADTNVAQITGNATKLTGGVGEKQIKVKTTADGASVGEVCTAANLGEGRACVAGGTGPGNGQFEEWPFGGEIAAGPDGLIYVGDRERIQKFDAGGSYVGQIAGSALAGETVQSLAVDPSGDVYVAFAEKEGLGFFSGTKSKPNVHKLSGAGTALCTDAVANPRAIASDGVAGQGEGSLYVVDRDNHLGTPESSVREFNPGCAEVGTAFGREELKDSTGLATGSPCLSVGVNVYASSDPDILHPESFVRAYGPHPDNSVACPPAPNPPQIKSQHALSVGTEEATLRARINPEFWEDTSYYLEYGTEDCALHPCESKALSPGAQLGAGVTNEFITTKGVQLTGLLPNTTYYYRFLAKSSGGGPIKGDGGKVGEDGPARHFTTAPKPLPGNESCPNSAFRNGAAAKLPDCRAYEMVSPVDKGNADIAVPLGFEGNGLANFDQAAQSGGALAYTSFRSFGGAESALWANHYLARRGAGGWSTEPISPPREGLPFGGGAGGLTRQYVGFSADLCNGWLQQVTEPVLVPGTPDGFPNLYRRGLCGQPEVEGSPYEPIVPVEPPNLSNPSNLKQELQGFSADATRTVFRIHAPLAVAPGGPSAAAGAGYQVYEQSGGELRLVSVLPNGTASASANNSAGSPSGAIPDGRHESAYQAVSADGSRIYWSDNSPGSLYLRLNAEEDQSAIAAGACTEFEKACTVKVSTGALAKFLWASRDGTRALYSEGSQLREFEYDPESDEVHRATIAGAFKGLMGASADAKSAYLASGEVLGAGAKAGQANLYFYEAGEGTGTETFGFIATLAAADALAVPNQGALAPLSIEPASRSARVSPDGLHAAFTSAASLTGYDNADAENDKADAEVFVYDATSKELHCASCDPSGARPIGRDVGFEINEYWEAAGIPPWESQLYASHALSDDGSRLFFNSFQPLVLADTNGKADVYEWEALGKYCKAEDPGFSPSAGGCVRLISSGQSPSDSAFVDADPSGDNAFFKTESSLVGQDPGLIDVYDARAQGGFLEPPPGEPECVGTNCQSPAPAPNDPTPSSETGRGPGNVTGQPRKPRKHKKHHRRHKSAHHKRANHGGRAAR